MWLLLVFVPSDTPLTVSVTEFVLAYTLTSVVGLVRFTYRRLVMYTNGDADQLALYQ
jgi:hypothetical protein